MIRENVLWKNRPGRFGSALFMRFPPALLVSFKSTACLVPIVDSLVVLLSAVEGVFVEGVCAADNAGVAGGL